MTRAPSMFSRRCCRRSGRTRRSRRTSPSCGNSCRKTLRSSGAPAHARGRADAASFGAGWRAAPGEGGGIGLHLVSAWPAGRGPLRVRRFVQLRTSSSGRLRRLHRRRLFVVTVLNELCAFLRLLHSTWSVYRTDVLSGEISWRNPCHNDETFWRQNMLRFEENDCKVLR